MTKIFKNVHLYINGDDGEPKTDTPRMNDPIASGTAGSTQATGLKSRRESTIWQSRFATITRNASAARVLERADILAAIDTWVANAPEGLGEDYRGVAQQIRTCMDNRAMTCLQIDNRHVRTLPPLPPHVKSVDVSGCHALTAAPDLSACRKLEQLVINRCSALTTPPDLSACTRLQLLNMSGCTALTTPPDVSACQEMTSLNLNNCIALATAPDVSMCTKMKTMYLNNCNGISSLSGGWSALTNMDVLGLQGVPLASLPEDILQLPRGCRIEINANDLSDAIVNRLSAAMNVPTYTGPIVNFARAMPSARETRPLETAVQSWRDKSKAPSTSSTETSPWLQFKQEEGAADFSLFLDRLEDTSEFKNRKIQRDFIKRARDLLDQLELPANKELRAKCFVQAGQANDTCGDRVALCLIHMETFCALHHLESAIENGEYDDNPAALCEAAKGFHRMEQIEKMAHRKVASLNFVDEIEVHLGYLVQLSDRFELPVKMKTMLYPACSNITRDDLKEARAVLSGPGDGKADPALLRFLAAWEPAKKLLKRLVDEETMTKTEADIGEALGKEQTRIQEAHAALPNGPNKEIQSRRLMDMYHRLEPGIRSRFMASLVNEYLQVGA
jgi:E3 ubiquitin-protein ligase SspH2